MTRELTGRHVLLIVCSAFAVIVGVNFFMAYKAVGTFPGLEGQNTYYASKNFDAERQAQQALGWTVSETYTPGQLSLNFTDKSGQPAVLSDLEVLVGRATIAEYDQRPVFLQENGQWQAALDLGPGKWLLRIDARAADGTRFRQSRQIYIAKG